MLKPFLQDVVQFGPLARVLAGVTLDAPLSIPPLLLHVGILPLADWIGVFLEQSRRSWCVVDVSCSCRRDAG